MRDTWVKAGETIFIISCCTLPDNFVKATSDFSLIQKTFIPKVLTPREPEIAGDNKTIPQFEEIPDGKEVSVGGRSAEIHI